MAQLVLLARLPPLLFGLEAITITHDRRSSRVERIPGDCAIGQRRRGGLGPVIDATGGQPDASHALLHRHSIGHRHGDGRTLPFADASFDFVILSETLQAIHHQERLLKEMLRVGREAIVSFPNFGHWQARLQIALGQHLQTPAAHRRLHFEQLAGGRLQHLPNQLF